MICSCLIPSRGRFDQLVRAVNSLRATAASVNNFEVLIRLDDDDVASTSRIAEVESLCNVKVLVGPTFEGYSSIDPIFLTELAKIAVAPWCWILNDDMTIEGGKWDEKLMQIPTTGYIVQTEFFRLNQSVYHLCEGGNFPCVPTRCWEIFGWERLLFPSDTGLDQLLRIKNGWKTWFLPGITAWHQRNK